MEDKIQVVIVVGGALALAEIEAIKSRIPGGAVVRAVKVEDVEELTRKNERPFIVFDEAHYIPAENDISEGRKRECSYIYGSFPKMEPLDYEREVLQIPTYRPETRHFEKPDRIPAPQGYKRNRFAR